mmetsp:Transcript_49113/g.163989  ORF Transcript_49113/g.163989 Transcript_49113/m.163989 type:complete len:207 (+) Transcript_49113:208-828(+)
MARARRTARPLSTFTTNCGRVRARGRSGWSDTHWLCSTPSAGGGAQPTSRSSGQAPGRCWLRSMRAASTAASVGGTSTPDTRLWLCMWSSSSVHMCMSCIPRTWNGQVGGQRAVHRAPPTPLFSRCSRRRLWAARRRVRRAQRVRRDARRVLRRGGVGVAARSAAEGAAGSRPAGEACRERGGGAARGGPPARRARVARALGPGAE